VERIEWRPRREIDRGEWPYAIPAVAQLIDEAGFEVPEGVTILVGENGSGKSTLVEAFAAVYPRRGSSRSESGECAVRPGKTWIWCSPGMAANVCGLASGDAVLWWGDTGFGRLGHALGAAQRLR
jgi:energy-coupling factor transporter ATP-binding protein EcfA2